MLTKMNIENIRKIRRFNRFYTGYMGFLNRKMLGSDYSFTEARLLYELAHRKMTKASVLTAELALDPGYLSRILTRFEKAGLISKQPCKIDGRSTRLIITDHGTSVATEMGDIANSFIDKKLSTLNDNQLSTLVSAMEGIGEILGEQTTSKQTVSIRNHRPGDIGWIIQVLGEQCSSEFGFNQNFEVAMAQSATNFISNYDPSAERGWIAELNGERVGSIVLTKEKESTSTLRLFYLSPKARGLKLGQRLIDECLSFAEKTGYRHVELKTTKNLKTARHLYQKAGFQLVKEETSSEFGPAHTNQYWRLTF
ncbi:MAG: GNAT family N-acetyltransferase [Kordiimonas sp.]